MIYAVATTDKTLSHQFSKSHSFTFYNEDKKVIAVYKNPALDAKGCGAKKQIVELFKKMQCDLVIVRKIGEKTLARLLDAGLKVEQGNTRHDIEQLLTEAAANKNSLTSPEQGVQKKSSESHSDKCCSHEGGHKHSHSDKCCSDEGGHKHNHSHKHQHGKQRCCGKH